MDRDECLCCGQLLDAFGQCFQCDTEGAPQARRPKPAELKLKRCSSCRAAHYNAGSRCDYCEGHDISPEDFQAWAEECDLIRDRAEENYCS